MTKKQRKSECGCEDEGCKKRTESLIADLNQIGTKWTDHMHPVQYISTIIGYVTALAFQNTNCAVYATRKLLDMLNEAIRFEMENVKERDE